MQKNKTEQNEKENKQLKTEIIKTKKKSFF